MGAATQAEVIARDSDKLEANGCHIADPRQVRKAEWEGISGRAYRGGPGISCGPEAIRKGNPYLVDVVVVVQSAIEPTCLLSYSRYVLMISINSSAASACSEKSKMW
jgi:hypothetical protein